MKLTTNTLESMWQKKGAWMSDEISDLRAIIKRQAAQIDELRKLLNPDPLQSPPLPKDPEPEKEPHQPRDS